MKKYDNYSIPTENTDQVKYYCLKMALEGKRTSPKDLNNLLKMAYVNKY
jgi:hypothetical protein